MPEPPPSARLTLTSLSHRLLVRRVILPWLLQGDQPSGEGLEVGAGRGVMTAELLARFPRFRMVATDYSTERVTSAEQVLAGFGRRVSVQRADAARLPFADGRFDLVLSAAMLHHVIEWDQALAEAVRVLRPGGRLIGYDMLDTPPIRLMHIAERDSTLLLRAPRLEAALGRLDLTDLRTATALGGTFMRFSARKPALPLTRRPGAFSDHELGRRQRGDLGGLRGQLRVEEGEAGPAEFGEVHADRGERGRDVPRYRRVIESDDADVLRYAAACLVHGADEAGDQTAGGLLDLWVAVDDAGDRLVRHSGGSGYVPDVYRAGGGARASAGRSGRRVCAGDGVPADGDVRGLPVRG